MVDHSNDDKYMHKPMTSQNSENDVAGRISFS